MASLRAIRRGGALVLQLHPTRSPIVLRDNRDFFALVASVLEEAEEASFIALTSQQRFASAAIALSRALGQANARFTTEFGLGVRRWSDDVDGEPTPLVAAVMSTAARAVDSDRRQIGVDLLEALTTSRPSEANAWLQLFELNSMIGRTADARTAYNGWRVSQGNVPLATPPRESTRSKYNTESLRALLTTRYPANGDANDLRAAVIAGDVQTEASAAMALNGRGGRKTVQRVAQLVLRDRLAQDDAGPDDEQLAAAYADARSVQRAPLVPGDVGALKTMDLPALRRYLDGRSIALVANSGRVAASGLGAQIDAYDLVARFNSFAIDPAHTGTKTNIHATIHLHDFNWDVPVDVRLVFGGDQRTWGDSIRRFLIPEAQEWIGDESLRWPVRSESVVGDEQAPGVPTSGFNLMRMLDFLDVSPVIDLIGFDFNASGAYRTEAAMRLPVGTQHHYDYERDWVDAHAVSRTDWRISLR